jgi:hypothetical protein
MHTEEKSSSRTTKQQEQNLPQKYNIFERSIASVLVAPGRSPQTPSRRKYVNQQTLLPSRCRTYPPTKRAQTVAPMHLIQNPFVLD